MRKLWTNIHTDGSILVTQNNDYYFSLSLGVIWERSSWNVIIYHIIAGSSCLSNFLYVLELRFGYRKIVYLTCKKTYPVFLLLSFQAILQLSNFTWKRLDWNFYFWSFSPSGHLLFSEITWSVLNFFMYFIEIWTDLRIFSFFPSWWKKAMVNRLTWYRFFSLQTV